MIVIDASVACKLYVEEPSSEEARALVLSARSLIAPDLIVAEVANVLWKRHRASHLTGDQASAGVLGITKLCDELVATARLAHRALTIAMDLEHPVYDCLYLALAEERGVPLVTADQRLVSRLRHTSWIDRVTSLAEAAKP